MRRRSFTTHCFSLRTHRLCYVPAWVSAQRGRGAARATTAYQRLTGSSSALVIRSFSTASRLAGRLDAIVQAR